MKKKLFTYFLVVLSSLFFTACSNTSSCLSVSKIEGAYKCSGECVVTNKDGSKALITVPNELDVIELYPNSKMGLYRVNISSGDFKEIEIGALSGLEMRTATSAVSDGNYPVLEEFLFTTDEMCRATGYTKVVLNPTKDDFKACNILCGKQ